MSTNFKVDTLLSNLKDLQSETLKVAQLKVTQTQGQTDSLEEANQKRRDKIAAINKTIESEKARQQENVDSFEEHLADLTEKLIKARSYYKDENLKNEVVSQKKRLEDIKKTLSERTQEVEALTAVLDQTKMHNMDTETKPSLPVDTCQLVWQMVKEENKAIHSYLGQLQMDLKGIHDTPQTQTAPQ